MTGSINQTSGINLAELGLGSTSSNVETEKLGQEDFFELLVAQLEFQDPLEPQSNTEFVAQIANFGVLDSVQGLQRSFDSLNSNLQSNQALQASALVGRAVVVNSNSGILRDSNGIAGNVSLEGTTSNLSVAVTNEVGEVVRTLSLGTVSGEDIAFKWDGLNDAGQAVPFGTYQFTAQGGVGNEVVGMPVFLDAMVESVTFGGTTDDMKLNLGPLGSISLKEVVKIK